MLRLQDVSCALRDRVILDRVNLSLASGELTLVRGGRGAGKSTLLAVAAVAVRPGAGRVFVAERDIVGLQGSSLPFVRRNIGYLPPEPPLILAETAAENVMLALAVRGSEVHAAQSQAAGALRLVGLPVALDEALVRDLSWAERRLVALARAIAGTPPLVVLDEPAAGMDGRDRAAVVKALCSLRDAGAAVLCASADADFAALVTAAGGTCVELENGRLIGGPRMTVLQGERVSPAVAIEPAAGAIDRSELQPEQELGDDDLEAVSDDPAGGQS